MGLGLVEYVANSVWQVPLLAAGAWLLVRMIKPRPIMHHRVWLAVLAMAVILPSHNNGKTYRSMEPVRLARAIVHAFKAMGNEPADGSQTIDERQIGERSRLLPARMENVRLPTTVTHWLVGLYLTTIVVGALRLVYAWRAAQRLVRHSHEMRLSADVKTAFVAYCHRLGVDLPQVRESKDVLSPMIIGVAKPALLLPPHFSRHTDDEKRAALCHELAHVLRRDYGMNLLCRLIALPVAWHPGAHAIQQRIRTTREIACDAVAAEEVRSQAGYARCLVSLARQMLSGNRVARRTHALGLFESNTLEERVSCLLEKRLAMSDRVRMIRAVTGGAAMVAAFTIALLFHVSPTIADAQATTLSAGVQNATDTSRGLAEENNLDHPITRAKPVIEESKLTAATEDVSSRPSNIVDREGIATVKNGRRETRLDERERLEQEIRSVRQRIAAARKKFESASSKHQVSDNDLPMIDDHKVFQQPGNAQNGKASEEQSL
jgi:beta-lactamase regulating signal transducer with metallopeptidase domain